MRIATWNVERLKHKAHLQEILDKCRDINADILVLTETDSRICPEYRYSFHTPALIGETVPVVYADTENRVSIFTNFECVAMHPTYDGKTAVCVELETDRGNLLVYGTIIGITGNRSASYKADLDRQIADINRLSAGDHAICMVGDYNCSFSDNCYYTKYGRESMLKCFSDNNMTILTADRPECIDHIAVSDAFLGNGTIKTIEWNYDKSLSDHKGIVVEI